MDVNSIIDRIRVYFNLMPDKDDEQAIIQQISSSVSFRGANLWVLIFAILIASLGLNVNSTAVIIGAFARREFPMRFYSFPHATL